MPVEVKLLGIIPFEKETQKERDQTIIDARVFEDDLFKSAKHKHDNLLTNRWYLARAERFKLERTGLRTWFKLMGHRIEVPKAITP